MRTAICMQCMAHDSLLKIVRCACQIDCSAVHTNTSCITNSKYLRLNGRSIRHTVKSRAPMERTLGSTLTVSKCILSPSISNTAVLHLFRSSTPPPCCCRLQARLLLGIGSVSKPDLGQTSSDARRFHRATGPRKATVLVVNTASRCLADA